jgi:hypothetical protein
MTAQQKVALIALVEIARRQQAGQDIEPMMRDIRELPDLSGIFSSLAEFLPFDISSITGLFSGGSGGSTGSAYGGLSSLLSGLGFGS